MSGTRGAYEPLRQTQRELESGREAGSPRNYEALRQTQQEVDARSASSAPQQQPQDTRSPYESGEERQAAHSQNLEALVSSGRISQSERIYRERQFDNQLVAEQKAYDLRLAKARELAEAARAQNSPEHQREMGRERE